MRRTLTWTCLTVAAIFNNGSYWPGGVLLLVIVAGLLYAPPVTRRVAGPSDADKSLSWIARIGTTVSLVLTLVSHAHTDGGVDGWTAVLIVSQGVAMLVAWLYALPAKVQPQLLRDSRLAILLVSVSVQSLIAILSVPDPRIDVFYFLSEGARGFLGGIDPYAMNFTALPASHSVGYQDPAYHFDVYAYLPGVLFLTAPAVLLGDVRLAMLVGCLGAAILLRQISRRTGASDHRADLAAAAFISYPGLLHIVQHAWVEPLIVAVWFAALMSQLTRPKGLGTPALAALLLVIKQYTAILLLPLMSAGLRWRGMLIAGCGVVVTVLPFLLWDPHAFLWDAISYQIQAPSRTDALSINGWLLNQGFGDLPGAISVGVPLLGGLWAYVGVLQRRPLAEVIRRTAGLYLLSFLFGKFAFANYYFLTQAVLVTSFAIPATAVLRRSGKVAEPDRYPLQAPHTPRGSQRQRPRVLVFIVAYNAARTIEWVLRRVPGEMARYDTEVLIIDDASRDGTFEVAERFRRAADYPFHLTVLANPVNQGYGGNQKLGFQYAVEQDFDAVALVHGDGQYAPEQLPKLVAPILSGEADAVFGSRMMEAASALKGGMPLYKYIGNRILTFLQNKLLGSNLTEFHTGYRVYAVDALKRMPFQLNSNVFHFDTEIIIQLLFSRSRIKELPIPTYYGDEVCHVNGLKYATDVLRASIAARLQAFHLTYRRNFDVGADREDNHYYVSKLSYPSTHQAAVAEVLPGETVLDIGCAGGFLADQLAATGCRVIGIDRFPPRQMGALSAFHRRDLDTQSLPRDTESADVVLLLDVIEHLRSPERFLEELRLVMSRAPHARVVLSTGNIGFIVTRVMLLLGQFNYGKRGILDLTHTRLFTFASLARALTESGYSITGVRGIPAPLPEVVHNATMASMLVRFNQWLIRFSRTLFAYQIYMVAQPLPTVPALLRRSEAHTRARCIAVEGVPRTVASNVAAEGRKVHTSYRTRHPVHRKSRAS